MSAIAPLIVEARRLYDAGLTLIPNNDRKQPVLPEWQSRTIVWESDLLPHLRRKGSLGLRMGDAGREAIDLDIKGVSDAQALITAFEQLIQDFASDLFSRLVIQRSRSGGRHYLYRCPAPEGNQILARMTTRIALLETRGVGGQLVISPTAGYTVLQGDLAVLPVITQDERNLLLALARSLDHSATPSIIDQRASAVSGERPGDQYNANGGRDEALSLLESAGWTIARTQGETCYLTRPGKHPRAGISATFGHIAPGILHVFTSSDSTFEPGNYSPFAILTKLTYGGDFQAAARALAQQGYGAVHPRSPSPPGSAPASTPATPAGAGTVSARIRAALTSAGYTFQMNALDHWVEVNGERLTDEIEAQIIMDARDQDVRPIEAVRPFIIAEAAKHPYHPIKDYLNGLVWDRHDHIATLCTYLTSSDPPVDYPGGSASLHSVYLYRWLIGAVAKVLEQAQNLALVLAGPQGIGKSTFARWLCSGLGDAYFLEMPIDPHDKDNDLRQMRSFIWEIAELDATTRKADMSALKAFITRQTATVRKAYGRYDTVRPTNCSFIGTVNKGEGFLSDPTGNRRFLVTTLTAINHAYAQEMDIDQVWAEAVARYRAGESWRLRSNELQAQCDANAEHEFDSPLEGWLSSHFRHDPASDAVMTSAQIIDHLRRFYDIRLSGSERSQAMAISQVCQRMGIERRRSGRGMPYVYWGLSGRFPHGERDDAQT